MRVAFIVFTDFPERTAPARRVHLLGKGLAVLGHDVHVVVPQRFAQGPLEQVYDGLSVHWCANAERAALRSLPRRVGPRVRLLHKVDRLARQGLDWLVTYNLGMDALPIMLSARRNDVHIAAMYDDLRAYPKQMKLEDRARRMWLETADRWLPRQAHLNIAISTFLAERLVSLAKNTPCLVIPPLVDPQRFTYDANKAAAFRSQWGLGDLPLISYLGTYWHVEGLAVFLRAVSELVRSGLSFRVAISGEAAQGLVCDDVPGLVQELNLQKHVVLTGWLSTDGVIAAMAAADVLVVPKLDHVANRAGVPTKLAEYLAMGRAIATSKVGDVPRYLVDGQDALLCEPGDVTSWTSSLRRLLESPDLCTRLGNGAREAALRHFDYRQAGQQLEMTMMEHY